METEIVQLLFQVGGTPAMVGFVLYFMWTHGPKRDLERMADTVDSIGRDLRQHREAVLAEQAGHRERIQRLELKEEAARAERRRLFKIRHRKEEDGHED